MENGLNFGFPQGTTNLPLTQYTKRTKPGIMQAYPGLASSSPGTFNPIPLSAVLLQNLYFDYSYDNTYTDGAMINKCSIDGDQVYAWKDMSGNGRHLTQATIANRAVFSATNTNAYFNGSTTLYTLAGATLSTTCTIYTVLNLVSTGASRQGPWEFSGGVNFDLLHGGGTANLSIQFPFQATAAITLSADTRTLVTCKAGGTISSIQKNNESVVTTSTLPGAATTFSLGACGGIWSEFRLTRFIAYSGNHSATQMAQIQKYLNALYTIY
jgi:hypothetical protein